MRIGRSSLVVLGILFAVLVAFSCGDDDDGPDATPTQSASSPSPAPDDFGGPYPFKKLADFRFYLEKDLSISKVEKLEEKLFIDSIKANDGDEQKYNYAIDADQGVIFVAVWSDNASGRLSDILIDEKICIPTKTPGSASEVIATETPRPASEVIATAKIMINWLTEEEEESPCRLRVGGELLDALSKHFMLAQGLDKQIGDYDEANWLRAKVAYAGEILVNVEECTFTVNGDSGTYKPTLDDGIGQRLAGYFHSVLDVAPTKVNRYDVQDLNTEIPGLGC